MSLTVTGVYTIAINPYSASGGVTATLTQLVTEGMSFNTPLSVSSTLAGQMYNLTFSGTAGETIDVTLYNSTFNGGCWAASVLDPNGNVLANDGSCGTASDTGSIPLTITGVYTIAINPYSASGGVTANVALIQ